MRETLTVIVPTFNEEMGLNQCFEALDRLTNDVLKLGVLEVSVLFSDNHSTDKSWEMLINICEHRNNWSAIQLDRNYGAQASLLKAMSVTKTNSVLVFQSDLQDPIESPGKYDSHSASGYGPCKTSSAPQSALQL